MTKSVFILIKWNQNYHTINHSTQEFPSVWPVTESSRR